MKPRPINVASPELTREILAIEPSLSTAGEVIRPCSLLMADDTIIPRAYCRENARYSDDGDWVDPAKVRGVRESPLRLPPRLARKLYKAGESGMGYVVYLLRLRLRARLRCRLPRSIVCASGGYVDFPDLPEGITTRDIAGVVPHAGRKQSNKGYRSDAPYVFLDYVPFDSPMLSESPAGERGPGPLE